MSESPLGSSTVIFTRAEFVALPATSKKDFMVSGRHLNSMTKLSVSASASSLHSSHMTPAASTSAASSKRKGSPHMYWPLHGVFSFILALRQAKA